jgi:uncharacterized membrane protein YkvA (DUF1232 family)
MDQPGRHARRFAEWIAALPSDTQTMLDLLTDESIATQGRLFIAGALGYILTQLDIIPDHEKAGAIDDAFVVRVCFGLLAEHAEKAGADAAAKIGRLANEEDEVKAFLGDALFAKLRNYIHDFAEKAVRGRTTDQILADPRARADIKRELDAKLKKVRALSFESDADAESVEVTVRSYFKMKLGG